MDNVAKDVMKKYHTLLLGDNPEAMFILDTNHKFMDKIRGEWLKKINKYTSMNEINIIPT